MRRGIAAAAVIIAIALFVSVPLLDATPATPDEPNEESQVEAPIVYDEPAPSIVPIFTQTDERWGGLPYADGSVSTSGCGLTCAAMAWSYLSGEAWTPTRLLNAVGNSCVEAGVNNMQKFADWMCSQDPTLDRTVTYESTDRALGDLEGDRLVFGAMTGRLTDGGREYGGHIVLLVGADDGVVTIHDPCEMYAVTLAEGEFEAVDWTYFVSIGRSQ